MNGQNQNLENELLTEELYSAIMTQINIPVDENFSYYLVLGILKRQTTDQIIFSIWKNLNENEAKDMKNSIENRLAIAPDSNYEAMLMDFAFSEPVLREKIYKDLAIFFQSFIEKFRQIFA